MIMMIELYGKETGLVSPFYINSTDSTIYSLLQGYMGRAFVDDKDYIKHTIILQGDFIFPSGVENEFDERIAHQMLQEINLLPNGENVIIIPQNHAWHDFLSHQPQVKTVKRYAFHKMRLIDFDVNKLEEITKKLPDGFVYRRFDETLCKQALSMDWARDFCSNFESVSYYLKYGIGVAILKDDHMVCGASSYTAYKEGIEIEIVTKEDYRGMGLASCCGAKLILECIKEGKIPHWDAANQTSASIAKKLGFTYLGEYDTFVFER